MLMVILKYVLKFFGTPPFQSEFHHLKYELHLVTHI